MSEVAPSKLRRLFGLIRFLISLAGLLIIAGFIVFMIMVLRAEPPKTLVKADGIVVLTGTGGGRLDAASQLLSDDKGERLFVSGVDASLSVEAIESVLAVSADDFACCVDLDSAALDTIGNARETANWARALGYEHIILVTSDYHMPRAKLELSIAAADLRVTPYSVPVQSAKPLYKDFVRQRGLLREYGKLLLSYGRSMGRRGAATPKPYPAPEDVMKDQQAPPTLTGPVPITKAQPNTQDSALEKAKEDKPQ